MYALRMPRFGMCSYSLLGERKFNKNVHKVCVPKLFS